METEDIGRDRVRETKQTNWVFAIYYWLFGGDSGHLILISTVLTLLFQGKREETASPLRASYDEITLSDPPETTIWKDLLRRELPRPVPGPSRKDGQPTRGRQVQKGAGRLQ